MMVSLILIECLIWAVYETVYQRSLNHIPALFARGIIPRSVIDVSGLQSGQVASLRVTSTKVLSKSAWD